MNCLRIYFFTALLLFASTVYPAEDEGPLGAVSQRIDAYNQHDLQAFLQAHDENVEIYGYPDGKLGVGHKHLERVLSGRFTKKDSWVNVEVLQQIVFEKYVVSDEILTNLKTGAEEEHYVAIYEVENGLIVSIRLM